MAAASAGVSIALVNTNSAGCAISLAVYMCAFCLSIGNGLDGIVGNLYLRANSGSVGELFT